MTALFLQVLLPAPALEAGHGPGGLHLAVLGGATGLAPGVAQLPAHGPLEVILTPMYKGLFTNLKII